MVLLQILDSMHIWEWHEFQQFMLPKYISSMKPTTLLVKDKWNSVHFSYTYFVSWFLILGYNPRGFWHCTVGSFLSIETNVNKHLFLYKFLWCSNILTIKLGILYWWIPVGGFFLIFVHVIFTSLIKLTCNLFFS